MYAYTQRYTYANLHTRIGNASLQQCRGGGGEGGARQEFSPGPQLLEGQINWRTINGVHATIAIT